MKVGQWVRFKRPYMLELDRNRAKGENRWSYIGKERKTGYIYEIGMISKIKGRIEIDNKPICGLGINIIGEPKDNIEDLLEVGDIVHLGYQNPDKEPYNFMLRSDRDLNSFLREFKDGYYKITAIELHENRILQRVDENV